MNFYSFYHFNLSSNKPLQSQKKTDVFLAGALEKKVPTISVIFFLIIQQNHCE